MSELRSPAFNSPVERYGSSIEATPFTNGDRIDTQGKSTLGTPDEGRLFAERARQAIDEALRNQLPRIPTPEEASRLGAQSIMQSGVRTLSMRHLETQPEEALDEAAHFDLWKDEFDDGENTEAWVSHLDEPSRDEDLNTTGYELTGSRG